MKYTYHIEDGQFSRDIVLNKLLGNPGSIVTINDYGETIEAYILFIDGDYIECVGNIDREFPKNWSEHYLLLNIMNMDEAKDFTVYYMDREKRIFDLPMTINAKDKEQAIKVFNDDYVGYEVYNIEEA